MDYRSVIGGHIARTGDTPLHNRAGAMAGKVMDGRVETLHCNVSTSPKNLPQSRRQQQGAGGGEVAAVHIQRPVVYDHIAALFASKNIPDIDHMHG